MIPYISTSDDYMKFQRREKSRLTYSDFQRLHEDKTFKFAKKKMRLLEPERIREPLVSCYAPKMGRPAIDPIYIIRSFLLMLIFGYTSIDKWVRAVKADILLQYLIGTWNVPSISAHYDFINRVTHTNPTFTELYPKNKNSRFTKAKIRELQLKAGEKWVNFDDGDTFSLAKKYKDNADCDKHRPSRTLENIFNLLVVQPSMEKFINGDFILSGDGTALHIHSNLFGHHVENPVDDDHAQRYTAPTADCGWDSDLGVWYFGFTLFTISYHSKETGIDVPMFITLRTASQHDALTTISATAQMLDVNPSLLPKYICFDSASDAAHIHRFLRLRGMIPIIDWNPRHSSSKNPYDECNITNTKISKNGIPVCARGDEMCRDGYDYSKMATKFRCPLVCGRVHSCQFAETCSPSSYGRVVKIFDKTNYKLFGPVPHNSEEWKEIYKNRTSTERINKRILKDYKLEALTCYNESKHFFFSIIAGINIHLDAWAKKAA